MVSIPISSGHCNFVDYEGLNDQITTTSTNQSCCTNFRREVQDRDGESCIITQEAAVHCDAAHLISHSKGDEVLFMIIVTISLFFYHIARLTPRLCFGLTSFRPSWTPYA